MTNPPSAIHNPHLEQLDLSIVIVNYNSWGSLADCLRSIQAHAGILAYEIIVVDNASSDDSAANLATLFPQVRRIENSTNLGFARACNQAMQISTGRCILLLNPDTYFISGTLSDAVSYLLSHPDIGILGGKLLNEDGTLQLACRRSIPTTQSALFRFAGLSRMFPKHPTFAAYNLTYTDENEIIDVGAVSGACLMIERQLIDIIGGLDEQFFIYGEDLDWCLRVTQMGKRVVYWPRIILKHLKGQSGSSRRYASLYHFYHAMWLFYRKHHYENNAWWENWITCLGIWALALGRFLSSALKGMK